MYKSMGYLLSVFSPCVPGATEDLRLPIQPVVEALEGKWDSRRIVEKRRGTLPWVG
jgi:hypothetical protein